MDGLEPPPFCISDRRSNRLSYILWIPIDLSRDCSIPHNQSLNLKQNQTKVEPPGLEPGTF